jgi:hypothetical protein
MIVPIRRTLPALLVLFVLFASQLAYAAQAASRPSGHCAGHAPAEKTDKSCPLPLWLTCCDEQPAVGTAASQPGPSSLLALATGSELAAVLPHSHVPLLGSAEVPPDTPLRLSVVLLI